jgi:hypothetical protein
LIVLVEVLLVVVVLLLLLLVGLDVIVVSIEDWLLPHLFYLWGGSGEARALRIE